jgi:hypothetical protein
MTGNQLKSLFTSSKKKPSKAPDGKSDDQAAMAPIAPKTSIIHDLATMGTKNTATVVQALTTLASGEPLDDKELLLEHGVSMLQTLPPDSGLADKAAGDFIALLWNDLPHPATTNAGPSARYRRHDGGGNNPWDSEMGKAGSPYSRSVPPVKTKGPCLPDPELVYDQLLKRSGPFREHPSGLNRLFFSFATMVIHECFQTSRTDPWINETSSYVDLSTIYGNTEKEQKRVRTYEDGKIFPDSVASERIMMMPPGVVGTSCSSSHTGVNNSAYSEVILTRVQRLR